MELTTDDEFLGRFLYRHPLDTVRSGLVAVLVLAQHLAEKGDVADGQLQGVHLAEPLLVRQGGYVGPQPFEGFVDALHAAPFA